MHVDFEAPLRRFYFDACGFKAAPRATADNPREAALASAMLVDIVVFDGLDEMDAWGPAEVFRSGAKRGADMQVRLVTPTP